MLSGDEDVPILHFAKHYRLPCPVIPDNTDSLRHVIRVSGIANVAVFGGDGTCVFNDSWMGEDVEDFKKVIDKALKKIRGPNRKKSAYVEGGIVYPPDVGKSGKILHERMPSLAVGPDGCLHLAFVSDEDGANDILLRSSNARGRWGKPVPIAATDADEYAPSVAVTRKGEVIVAYVAGRKGDRYDIHTVAVKKGKPGRPKRVTRSPDDAMAPSLAYDGKSLWLAWYEWRMMGSRSRDREIFVARGAGGGWSKPVQVSPKGVPAYEDHADPVVAPDGKGGAWVAWAWDYHASLPSKPPVDENSIFVRHVDARLGLGPCLAAGYRGEGRARDYAPTLAVTPDGTPWVAWDNHHKASSGYNHKGIFANRLAGEDFGEQYEIATNSGPICTPRLIVDADGEVHFLWARWAAKWEIRHRILKAGGAAEERRLDVKGKAPRYPTAVFDAEGRLWVAYVDTSSPRWRVLVEKIR